MTSIIGTPPTDSETAALDLTTQAAEPERERCEIRTAAGGRCSNEAHFYAVCHDCAHGLICEQHLEAFLAQIADGGPVQCNRCGREFADVADAIRVVDL